MSSSDITNLIPARLRSVFSILATVLAALLYAAVLGGAVVRTFLEPDPQFADSLARAASVLSGLVGSVVATGFARSATAASAPLSARHPLGGDALTGWSDLRPPSLARRKFLSLADTLGFRRRTYRPAPPRRSGLESPEAGAEPTTPEPTPTPTPHPAEGNSETVRMWIGIIYFVIYFLVGLAAFLVTIVRGSAPDVVSNAGWVWLGTVISSAYSYLGLNADS